MNPKLEKKIKKVKMLILDVDGVLTTGLINIDNQGNETKNFHVLDGFGIVLFHKAGFHSAIISARAADAVRLRAEDLGIKNIYQDAKPKTKAFEQILKDYSLRAEEVCFMGDDLPDLCLLNKVGLAVSVPNGSSEAQAAADYVTQKRGGDGAVREVIELILKGKGLWEQILKNMS
ncbi:MAG: HAD-IIIA family hydrolase [Candidatus Omnitrophica bacterium]|nr:HAD-IIIA family hydrolase [Candidatus Omnitrophota bacterium]